MFIENKRPKMHLNFSQCAIISRSGFILSHIRKPYFRPSSSTFDHLRKCRLVRWQVAASHRRANVEKQRLYPETNTIKTLTLLYGLHIETHKKKKQHIPVWGELQKRTIPSAKSSMLNAEFHSQCRLARVSLSLCNNIFEINISFQSSGQQDMSLLDFRLR